MTWDQDDVGSIPSTPTRQQASLVQPGFKTRRCQRRDPSSNLGRCTKHESGDANVVARGRLAQTESRAPRFERGGCGFESCTALLNSDSITTRISRDRNSNWPSASLPNSKLRVRLPSVASRARSQAAKAQVCKTCNRRFDSDRVLSSRRRAVRRQTLR